MNDYTTNKTRLKKLTPDQLELVTDFMIMFQKWTSTKIAKTFNMTRQGLQFHVDTKIGKRKGLKILRYKNEERNKKEGITVS